MSCDFIDKQEETGLFAGIEVVGWLPISSLLFTCGHNHRHMSSGGAPALIMPQVTAGSFSRLVSCANQENDGFSETMTVDSYLALRFFIKYFTIKGRN